MAFTSSSIQKTRSIQKQKSLLDFFNDPKRKRFAIVGIVMIAIMGAYIIFKTYANPNSCIGVEGGSICDVDQAIHNDDSVLNTNEEPLTLGNSGTGWIYTGTVFRAPNFPQNGAQPITRFFLASQSKHLALLPGPQADFLGAVGATREITLGYAWPGPGQPGTVPVYSYERSDPFTNFFYTTDKGQGDSFVNSGAGWREAGVAFYAYPPTYTPPAPPSAPVPPVATKDSDCPNASLKINDSGECVKALKGILMGLGSGDLNKENSTFDQKLNDVVGYSIALIKNAGRTSEVYGGTVTPGIWQAFDTALVERANPPADTASACPSAGGDTGLQQYIDGVNKEKKIFSNDCHKFWLTYAQNKSAAPAQTPATSTASTPQENPAVTEISACPIGNGANNDEVLRQWINGVNVQKVKYSDDCNLFWLTYAKNRNTAAVADSYEPGATIQGTDSIKTWIASCNSLKSYQAQLKNNQSMPLECHQRYLPVIKEANIKAANNRAVSSVASIISTKAQASMGAALAGRAAAAAVTMDNSPPTNATCSMDTARQNFKRIDSILANAKQSLIKTGTVVVTNKVSGKDRAGISTLSDEITEQYSYVSELATYGKGLLNAGNCSGAIATYVKLVGSGALKIMGSKMSTLVNMIKSLASSAGNIAWDVGQKATKELISGGAGQVISFVL